MWHVGMSKKGDGEIIYEPPAGPTIREAICNAMTIAKDENKEVEFHINDIIINVYPDSEFTSISKEYFLQLDLKYKQFRKSQNKQK